MATLVIPATGKALASFAHVAKHDCVGIDIGPLRLVNRKGVLKKAIRNAAHR